MKNFVSFLIKIFHYLKNHQVIQFMKINLRILKKI